MSTITVDIVSSDTPAASLPPWVAAQVQYRIRAVIAELLSGQAGSWTFTIAGPAEVSGHGMLSRVLISATRDVQPSVPVITLGGHVQSQEEQARMVEDIAAADAAIAVEDPARALAVAEAASPPPSVQVIITGGSILTPTEYTPADMSSLLPTNVQGVVDAAFVEHNLGDDLDIEDEDDEYDGDEDDDIDSESELNEERDEDMDDYDDYDEDDDDFDEDDDEPIEDIRMSMSTAPDAPSAPTEAMLQGPAAEAGFGPE